MINYTIILLHQMKVVLMKTNANTAYYLPIFESEVENAIKTLKYDKPPGNDNIPSEFLKHGGESITKIFTMIFQTIWKTQKWPTSLIILIHKKGDSTTLSNYRTLSMISYLSKPANSTSYIDISIRSSWNHRIKKHNR